MQARFIGDPAEVAKGGGLSRTSLDAYGITFPMGEWRSIDSLNGAQRAKLSANPHFEVSNETSGTAADVVDEGDPGVEEHKARAASRKKAKASEE